MKGSKTLLAVSVLITAMAAASWMSGCSSSSTGSNGTPIATAGNTAVTSCATTSSGATTLCDPGLVNQLNCSGPLVVTTSAEIQLGKNLIGSMPQYVGYPIPGSAITSDSAIYVSLTPQAGAGPLIEMTLVVGGYPVSGNTVFINSTNPSNTNPNVGTIEMQPLATILIPVDLITFEPWDGSILQMPAVSVNISGQLFGVTALACAI